VAVTGATRGLGAAIALHCARHGARVVVFLISDEAAFMTGSEVVVDGGLIAAGRAHMRKQMQTMFAAKHAPS
jgi:NAD(P)-dependent dehydrogenase (short-subunit alcohol dehydrogenase family)